MDRLTTLKWNDFSVKYITITIRKTKKRKCKAFQQGDL